jgi:predicted dehydrogenase
LNKNKKIKAAVIGLGVGLHHARTLFKYNNCDLVWICDSNQSKLSEIGNEFNEAKLSQNDQEVLNDPEINLVCIASYDEAHHVQVIDALKNNKHVYVEKPLCLKENQAREIQSILKANSKLKMSSNMVLRTCPLFLKIRQKVKEKAMGEIYYLEADYLWGRKQKLISGWRAEADFYSIIHGAAVHMIDLAVWIIGKKPVSVQALGNQIATKGTLQNYNDFATLLLNFEDEMIVKVSAHGGCVHPHFHSLKVFGKNLTFIHETTGTVWVESNNPNDVFKPEDADYPAKTQRSKALVSFLESIINNDKNVLVTDEEVLSTSSICLAAEESIKTGQKINIEYL